MLTTNPVSRVLMTPRRLLVVAAAVLAWQSTPVTLARAPVVDGSWRAQWIADPTAPAQEAGVYHFRKDFELVARPDRFVVRVSADNRYRLFVNEVEVSNGPAGSCILGTTSSRRSYGTLVGIALRRNSARVPLS
jgi:hypothetical protein